MKVTRVLARQFEVAEKHALDVHPARVKVTRVLARQFEVAGNRYSRHSGKSIGGG